MTGGVFTKVSLGIGFMSLILVFGLGFMVQMGNEYNVELEQRFSEDITLDRDFIDIQLESADILESGGIDQQTTDIAQLRGGISSQQNQLSNFRLLRSTMNDLIRVFPYDPQFNIILFGLLTTMFVGGIIYLLFGRKP